ncbi:pyridoxamine 5'-phosphate oxidase family protein [Methylobacterium sp. WL120]|uniref:pyridoxamine 5'-phosphate oxidase family protein n=1 Tax=Methylobacterium sp. WL120 TaxID=2603887 RepID=UPI0011CC4EBF|nr:pyridoxamine 5'-phosphate oxidase family protein [Methylobacterium sp. WL120]TXM64971.1 pyridoxamine 5'-phosphate oxidase family protein [Methylobacterium sp. WL120]
MPNTYFHTLFGEAARTLQAQAGSRASYARRDAASPDERDALTEREHGFLAARDSVYLASVGPDGWPYLQHRGGPAGFVRALGGNRIGFADYPGNRQFISQGNVIERGRVALFAMDYPARRRLKLIGHARVVAAADDPDLVAQVVHPDAPPAASAFVVDVVGFDWNCPQYIEPRFTRAEIAAELRPLLTEVADLRAEVARLRDLPVIPGSREGL